MGVTFALLGMLSFALNVLILRNATARLAPELGFTVLLTTNVAFATLVGLAQLAIAGVPEPPDALATFWFAASGVVGIFLGRRFMVDAVRRLGPARASTLHTASPVATLAAAWLVIGERLGPYEMLVFGIVVLGLWLLQGPARGAATGDWAGGLGLAVLTVAGFAFGNVFRGMGVREWSEPVLGTLIASAAALACQVAATRDWRALAAGLRAADPRGPRLYVASGVASVCGSLFSTAAMAHMEISIAMAIVYSTPLVIFPISVFVLGNAEQVRVRTVAGAACALAGVLMLVLR